MKLIKSLIGPRYTIQKTELDDLDQRNMSEYRKIPHIQTVIKQLKIRQEQLKEQIVNMADESEYKALKGALDELSSFHLFLDPPDTQRSEDA